MLLIRVNENPRNPPTTQGKKTIDLNGKKIELGLYDLCAYLIAFYLL
jgi:hypothetical protein